MRTLRDDGAAKVLVGHHHHRRGHDGHRRGQAVGRPCRSFPTKASIRAARRCTGVKDADNLRALRANLKRDGVLITEAKEASLRAAAGAQGAGAAAGMGLSRSSIPSPPCATGRSARRPIAAPSPCSRASSARCSRRACRSPSRWARSSTRSSAPGLKRVLADVKTQVNEGSSLGDAMARHPKVFQDLYVNMVRAGEASGNLERGHVPPRRLPRGAEQAARQDHLGAVLSRS